MRAWRNVMFLPISPHTIEGTRPAIAACPHARYELRTMNGTHGETGFVTEFILARLESAAAVRGQAASWGRVSRAA